MCDSQFCTTDMCKSVVRAGYHVHPLSLTQSGLMTFEHQNTNLPMDRCGKLVPYTDLQGTPCATLT